jgi:uncharacterized membrane protein
MATITDIILWISMGVGEIGSVIALYGRYRTLPAFLTGPNICRLEAGGCQVLFRTPNAALLGVPNSLLAVPYYPLLAWGLTRFWPLPLLLAASTFAFGMTIYLAWVLLRDKLECRICWTGHLCNTVIWLILLEPFLHAL